ncbi:CotH kinase family protein [bacterium]|nr:CotH kinase family protein [bacterium]
MRRLSRKTLMLFRRWRLLAISTVTAILFLPIAFVAAPVARYIDLLQVSGWIRMPLQQQINAQRLRIEDSVRPEFVPRTNDQVPLLDVWLAPSDLDQLESGLPLSGFQDKVARIRTTDGDRDVDFRYRGDTNYHWFYPKKSCQIKTAEREPLLFGRRLAIVNPKDGDYLVRYMGAKLAEQFNVLSPPCEMVLLNLNGRYQGVFNCLQPLDESFLRYRREMPGEIWEGDVSQQGGQSSEFFGDP